MKPRVHAITCIIVGCSPRHAGTLENIVYKILEHDCEIVERDSVVTGSAPSSNGHATIAIQIEVVGPIQNEPELGRVCNNIANAVGECTGKNVRISRQESGKYTYRTHTAATAAEHE